MYCWIGCQGSKVGPTQALVSFAPDKGQGPFEITLNRIAHVDVSLLPYNELLIGWLKEQKAEGRKLYLATAADRSVAIEVAQHLDIFESFCVQWRY